MLYVTPSVSQLPFPSVWQTSQSSRPQFPGLKGFDRCNFLFSDVPPRSTIRIFISELLETSRNALASEEFGVGGTNSTVTSPSFLNHSDRFVHLLSRRSAAFHDLGR